MKQARGAPGFAAVLVLIYGIAASGCGGGGEDDTCTPVDSAVCRGKANFSNRTLTGLGSNGRSCADCRRSLVIHAMGNATTATKISNDRKRKRNQRR